MFSIQNSPIKFPNADISVHDKASPRALFGEEGGNVLQLLDEEAFQRFEQHVIDHEQL